MDPFVSIFKGVYEYLKDSLISEVLNDIKVGKFKNSIQEMRGILDKDPSIDITDLKHKLLSFTTSGTFDKSHRSDCLKELSNLIVLDIDDLSKNQVRKIKQIAINDTHTYSCFISPSGLGIKIIVKCIYSVEHHRDAYYNIVNHYSDLLGIAIDTSGSNIGRPCFVSYDPDLFLNENSEPFPFEPVNFGNKRISQEQQYDEIYEECVSELNKTLTYVSGKRNIFLFQLAIRLNKNGLPLKYSLLKVKENYQDLEAVEIEKAVKNGYKNKREFGILKESRKSRRSEVFLQVEKFLQNSNEFRYNLVLCIVEFKRNGSDQWLRLTNREVNSFWRALNNEGLCISLRELYSILNSEFSIEFDPFLDFFSNLEVWDGKVDYIQQLADTVETTNQNCWGTFLKKWLVALVRCAVGEKPNETAIVLSGGQGIGKTKWVKKLLPNELKEYFFSGTINPGNKDTQLHLAECLVIDMDELENLRRDEIGVLKAIMTLPEVNIRRPYGLMNEIFKRKASFIGSVNGKQFLNDPTGSRRWLCFEVIKINYSHSVDMRKVYSQATTLLCNEYPCWFSPEEIIEIENNNREFQVLTSEEEYLLKYFSPIKNGQYTEHFLTTTEILRVLSSKVGSPKFSTKVLGSFLNKHRFERSKQKGIYGYKVTPLFPDDEYIDWVINHNPHYKGSN